MSATIALFPDVFNRRHVRLVKLQPIDEAVLLRQIGFGRDESTLSGIIKTDQQRLSGGFAIQETSACPC